MKIIKPSFEIAYPVVNPLKHIEKIARTCYKSEDKISEDDSSAIAMINNLVKRNHGAMLEHYNFVLSVSEWIYEQFESIPHKYKKYINMTNHQGRTIVSASARGFKDLYKALEGNSTADIVWYLLMNLKSKYECLFSDIPDNDKLFNFLRSFPVYSDLLSDEAVEALSIEERRVHQFVSVKFVCDRGVSHEIVRHRASFAQESTRYCNYSNDKFGRELTFIEPCFWEHGSVQYSWWERNCQLSEDGYFVLADLGAKPQEARSVLNNSLKTEVWMTAPLGQWEHFFNMRSDTPAHPQMRELAVPLSHKFKATFAPVYDNLKEYSL